MEVLTYVKEIWAGLWFVKILKRHRLFFMELQVMDLDVLLMDPPACTPECQML